MKDAVQEYPWSDSVCQRMRVYPSDTVHDRTNDWQRCLQRQAGQATNAEWEKPIDLEQGQRHRRCAHTFHTSVILNIKSVFRKERHFLQSSMSLLFHLYCRGEFDETTLFLQYLNTEKPAYFPSFFARQILFASFLKCLIDHYLK